MNESHVLSAEFEARDEAQRRRRKDQEIYFQDIRDVLALDNGAGKRVLKAWLHRLGLFGFVWRRGAEVHNTSSRHDAALEMYRDIGLADRKAAAELFTEGLAEVSPPGGGKGPAALGSTA